jgi:hypothetical protein
MAAPRLEFHRGEGRRRRSSSEDEGVRGIDLPEGLDSPEEEKLGDPQKTLRLFELGVGIGG